jgi:hypothetical protein
MRRDSIIAVASSYLFVLYCVLCIVKGFSKDETCGKIQDRRIFMIISYIYSYKSTKMTKHISIRVRAPAIRRSSTPHLLPRGDGPMLTV